MNEQTETATERSLRLVREEWTKHYRDQIDALRAELERERHDAWVALDGTNIKAVQSEGAERAHEALCRFLFPGYFVPRTEMVRAVIDALAGGDDWRAKLPARRAAIGPDPEAAVARMRAWAAANPSADTQGLMDDEWAALANAALGDADA